MALLLKCIPVSTMFLTSGLGVPGRRHGLGEYRQGFLLSGVE